MQISISEILGIVSVVIGGIISVLSIIFNYHISKKIEGNKDKYVLAKEKYEKLIQSRESIESMNEMPSIDDSGIVDHFIAVLHTMYSIKVAVLKQINQSFLRFVLYCQ